MRPLLVFLIAVAALLLAAPSTAAAAIALADGHRFLGEELEEWEDTSASATAADALARGDFRRPASSRPNHGFTRSAFFYRFAVRNDTAERRAYVVEVARSWVTDVDLYRVDGGVATLDASAGERIPRAERDVPSEQTAFAVDLAPGEERSYLLRLAGAAPISLLGEISPRDAFRESHTRGLLLWGGFYGVILGIALYSAIVFTVLRDAQWRLAPALACVALLEASAHGHLARLLPFVVPEIELRGCAVGMAAMLFTMCEWARVVLRTRTTSPRVDRALHLAAVLGGCLALLGGIVLRWNALAFIAPIGGSTALLVAGAARWRAGHAPARPFLVAVGAFVVPGVFVCATILGFLPLYAITEHGNHVGAVIMSVLFALGASQEMRVTRTDLEERNREITALADDLREQVVQRSRELSRVLEVQGRPVASATLGPGDVFDGRYRVVRRLGEGGMGAVYEAKRERDGRRLALKVLSSATTPATAIRLSREAEVGARLRHPNLVSIVDVGLSDGRTPFLVMEIVDGGSLEDQRARFGDVPWALAVLGGVAAGLRALHEAGVIHRDLKPSNVLMDGAVARICDFGIAKHADGEAAAENVSHERAAPDVLALAATVGAGALRARLTATGALVGTPLYMAPEALAGAPLEPSADVFSFGLMAYELVTGEFPLALFAAASLGVSGAGIPTPSLARVDGVPADVARILDACVAMGPSLRPSAADLAAALEAAAGATTSAAS